METKQSQVPYQIDVYNKNYETKKVEVFSNKKETHVGVIEMVKNKKEFLKANSDNYVMRVMSNDFNKIAFTGFFIGTKKYMYFDYFDVNQFQSNILDINIKCNFKKQKLNLELPYKSDMVCTLFSGKLPNNSGALKENKLCIIIENKSNSVKKINIFDKNMLLNGVDDKDFKIEIPINMNEIEFSSIRALSYNNKQMTMALEYHRNKAIERIVPSRYVDVSQFQVNVVDIPVETKLLKMEVDILPYTKIMYCFYNKIK
jgi:hypothetical protein